jgi:hypothetical protein
MQLERPTTNGPLLLQGPAGAMEVLFDLLEALAVGADHFFTGRLPMLRTLVLPHLKG